ncbi:putative MFS family arabinose efflux permease [Tamaricihabitans halophyticus]|uniref:Putative MFS family arabinose efflux permease n=1 Tax=Tamaricihabitans halophyticus TaxID=1262583 RepID=A0A4R2R2A5_9PSEU|nr:MFS transporter [Tamaricihabitans halophyticus]TCP56653.1 putative MFS family arabinose efflux permease [Tamaricihabitans halophyticus]
MAHDVEVAADLGQRERRTPSWPIACAAVAAAVCCNFLAIGAVVPVIPRFVAESGVGSAATLVGIAFAVTSVVALLSRPVGGRIAQQRGARGVIAVGSLVAMGAGVAYLLPLGTGTVLMIARLATGVAEALVMTAGSVWVVALAPAERRGRVIGWYGLAMWGGLTAGPVLGELAYRFGGFSWTWLAAAFLPGLALLLLLSPTLRAVSGRPSAEPVSRQLMPRGAILPGLALGAGGFGYACVMSFGALAMAERGIGNGAMLLALFSGAYVAVRLAGGWLPDRVGATTVILAAAIAEAGGLVLIAVGTNLVMVAIGAIVAGGGFSMLYPSLAVIAVESTPVAERGATLGAVTSFLDLSIVVAGIAGGLVAGAGYPAVFGLAAILALASCVAALRRG